MHFAILFLQRIRQRSVTACSSRLTALTWRPINTTTIASSTTNYTCTTPKYSAYAAAAAPTTATNWTAATNVTTAANIATVVVNYVAVVLMICIDAKRHCVASNVIVMDLVEAMVLAQLVQMVVANNATRRALFSERRR